MFDPVAVFEAQSGFGEVEESRGVCDAGPDHSRQEVEEGFLAHPDEQVGEVIQRLAGFNKVKVTIAKKLQRLIL